MVARVWDEVRALVRVTRIDNPEAMLVAPEQAWFLRENLKLRLLNARLALLSRQFDIAQSDLRDAQAALERSFDRSSRRVATATDLVRQVSLLLMAQAVIAQSVAIAVMPTFSAQHALGQSDEMRASLASTLRGVIFLAFPASIGLILLGEPLIAMLYQRGKFDAQDTQLVAWALLWYAAGMIGHSIMEILTRAFYAQHDTKTPVFIGVVAMGLNVVFSILFAKIFASIGWMPHGGLALANSFATALEAAALFIVMRKRLNGIDGKKILNGFAFPSGRTVPCLS